MMDEARPGGTLGVNPVMGLECSIHSRRIMNTVYDVWGDIYVNKNKHWVKHHQTELKDFE